MTNSSALILPANPSDTAATNDLRDISAPVEIPPDLTWLAWVLGMLLLAVAGYLCWRLWKRRTLPPVTVVVPAHLRARQRLREALGLIHQPLPFCVAVSDTIRIYLEERFNFHAPDRTTEEFLLELQSTPLMTLEQKSSLTDFLMRCDLVKFARYEPGEAELHQIYDSAVRLVDGTEPALVLNPTSDPVPPRPAADA